MIAVSSISLANDEKTLTIYNRFPENSRTKIDVDTKPASEGTIQTHCIDVKSGTPMVLLRPGDNKKLVLTIHTDDSYKCQNAHRIIGFNYYIDTQFTHLHDDSGHFYCVYEMGGTWKGCLNWVKSDPR